MSFGALITVILWQIATLGVATEILTMLLPWSLGLIDGTDPQLACTFFWFTGHPLVYYWLPPAYISWYAMLPKETGGKLFSDSLARFAFWLFLILSTPLGFHHQYVDPGVPTTWKYVHATLTVASAVTLSFMGISYWLVPYLTGKQLWKPKWAVAQSWIWFVGMLIFSNAMNVVGLLGAPRRVLLGLAPYVPEEWSGTLLRVGIGGGILFIGVYLYVVIMAATVFGKATVTERASENSDPKGFLRETRPLFRQNPWENQGLACKRNL